MQTLQNKKGLYLAVQPLSDNECSHIPSLVAALEDKLPGSPPNRRYLQAITDSTAPDWVKYQRLSALLLLTDLIFHAVFDTRSSLQLYRDEHGRPYVQTDASCPPLDFNLSHTDGLITCALLCGNGRVGIDAEGLLPYDRAHKLAERFYTKAEKKHLLSFTSEAAYAAEVTRLWTVKEAISKQIGTGNPVSYDGLCIPEGLKLHSHTYKAPDGSSVCISLCTPSDAEEPITVCRDNM